MYPLLETIKVIHGRYIHLEYHNRRLNTALKALYGTTQSVDLRPLLPTHPPAKGRFKCRMVYTNRVQSVEFIPYQIRPITQLQLVVCDSIDYQFKYADRRALETLTRLKGTCDDILIVKNGLVTDTSYCNVVFGRDGNYYTPEKPLLAGTCRQRLIDQGVIETAHIRPNDIRSYQEIYLINAMMELGELPPLPLHRIKSI